MNFSSMIFAVIVWFFLMKLSSSSGMKPKIIVLSPESKAEEETIDIAAGSLIHLRCFGQSSLVWSFPNNNNPLIESFQDSAQINLTSNNCFDDYSSTEEHGSCSSDVIIYDARYDMTGLFTCHYNQSSSEPFDMASDSLYIFINDPNNLIVPYENNQQFLFIAVFQSQPSVIPCRPTYSKASVTLWKVHTKIGSPQEIRLNSTLGITYNPRTGFHFQYPRWDSEMNILQCRYKFDSIEANSSISLHWSILPKELHPIIDDSQARTIFINNTFTLRCFVHIDIGVIIILDWQYPNKNETNKMRIVKSNVETKQVLVNQNSYHTVSMNLTIYNSTLNDQGLYLCNVTDGNGRMSTASKKIFILDQHIASVVNFTADFDNNQPIICQFGHEVRFSFLADAFPDISMVDLIWFKDDERLMFNETHFQIEVISDRKSNISFFIESSKPSDSGVYTLVGKTSKMSTNISALVYVKGDVDVFVENVLSFYQLNKSYELVCKAYAYPTAQIFWSWKPCSAPDDCSETDLYGETDWYNITTVHQHNQAILMDRNNHHSSPYRIVSTLKLIASTSGFYKCSAKLSEVSIKQEKVSFIVMDSKELFSIISSTNEPTLNETIILTCKASIYRFSEIWWTKTKNSDQIDSALISDLILKNETNITLFNSKNKYSLSSEIILKSVDFNDNCLFTCEAVERFNRENIDRKHFNLKVENVSAPVFIDSNLENSIIDVLFNTQTDLKCFVEGRPRPSIDWFHNGQSLMSDSGVDLVDRAQRLVFTRLMSKHSGLYECLAKNRGGSISKKTFIRVKGSFEDSLTLNEILFITLFVVVGIIIMVMAFFIGKRFREDKLRQQELNFFSQKIFEQGQMELFNPEIPLDEQIDLLPYDSRFEFPKERLRLGRTLGQGAFGRVVKADAIGLLQDDQLTTVAVKMLKERADANQRKALMTELKILIHLGRHLNIVNLLGAVTKKLAEGELLLIVEYCQFGNLRHYLLSNRQNFINQLNPLTDQIDLSIQDFDYNFNSSLYQNVNVNGPSTSIKNGVNNGSIARHDSISYVDLQIDKKKNMATTTTTTASDYINTSKTNRSNDSVRFIKRAHSSQYRAGKIVKTFDLICYAFQCARGMDYLTSRKLIHRDLAARNVLLASNNVVKICDFGLAKDVYKYDNYVKKDDGPLPIKWMAIESIGDKIFTFKSDVWSYGVLLWELFTLGKNPYPGLEIDEEFYHRLKNGFRMEKPDYASEKIYQLMLQCWNSNPDDRPEFFDIADLIGELLDDKTKNHYIDLNTPYSEMNQQILGSSDYMKMSAMITGTNNRESAAIFINNNNNQESIAINNNIYLQNDLLEMKLFDCEEADKQLPILHYDNLNL